MQEKTSVYPQFLQKQNLEAVLEQSVCIKHSHSLFAAASFIYPSVEGQKYFIKTYRHLPWIIRLFSRWFIQNEFRVLARISKLTADLVPVPVCIVEKDTLITQCISGGQPLKSVYRYSSGEVPEKSFFVNLIQHIRLLHENKICHGDLRRANILVMPDHHPVLVDWATGIVYPETVFSPMRLIYGMMAKSDNYSLCKIIRSFYPTELDEQMSEISICPPWYLRLGRIVRQKLYRRIRKKKKHSAGRS